MCVCVCVYVYMYTHAYIYTHICIYIYTYIYIYTDIQIYRYTYVFVYVYMCVCVWMCIHTYIHIYRVDLVFFTRSGRPFVRDSENTNSRVAWVSQYSLESLKRNRSQTHTTKHQYWHTETHRHRPILQNTYIHTHATHTHDAHTQQHSTTSDTPWRWQAEPTRALLFLNGQPLFNVVLCVLIYTHTHTHIRHTHSTTSDTPCRWNAGATWALFPRVHPRWTATFWLFALFFCVDPS